MKSIVIASDHTGVKLKEFLVKYLTDNSYIVVDLGPFVQDSVNYCDYAYKASKYIVGGEAEFGILICGSGIGMTIAANRFSKVRAALCLSEEYAKLAREHNNANILVLGARFLSDEFAATIVSSFLNTEFGGGRHEERVESLYKFGERE